MFRSLRRVPALVAVLVLIVIAAACGDDSDGAVATTGAPAATTAPATAAPTTRAPSVTTQAPATTTPPATADDADRVAAAGDAVSVHYVGTLDDGEQFDSSRDRGEPLSFMIATGQVIPGFDQTVAGMMVGDIVTVRVEPENAYGEWTEDLVFVVEAGDVPDTVEVGDQLFNQSTGLPVLVTEITDTQVTLDGNHPLAGEALTFEIELVSFDD